MKQLDYIPPKTLTKESKELNKLVSAINHFLDFYAKNQHTRNFTAIEKAKDSFYENVNTIFQNLKKRNNDILLEELKKIQNLFFQTAPSQICGPLFPWGGLYSFIESQTKQLRYEHVKKNHNGKCECLLLAKYRIAGIPNIDDLTFIEESNDYDDDYKLYICNHCGTKWKHQDCSTEQYSSRGWIITQVGTGESKSSQIDNS